MGQLDRRLLSGPSIASEGGDYNSPTGPPTVSSTLPLPLV